MAKVRVKMNCTSANAERILHEGKVYILDAAEANALLAPNTGPDGKAAATRTADGPAVKVTKPDPGEDAPPPDDDVDDTDAE